MSFPATHLSGTQVLGQILSLHDTMQSPWLHKLHPALALEGDPSVTSVCITDVRHACRAASSGQSCGSSKNYGGQEVVRSTNDIGITVSSACDCQQACSNKSPGYANTW